MSGASVPFPYGAVYFRKSNPPAQDWDRDYRTASEDGFTTFRHWFLWSAIEVAPGEFDWADYDAQLDLGHRYGIGTIIAEMLTAAPEWLYHERPEGRLVDAEGRPLGPRMGNSSATGGFPGMSLHDPVVRKAAQRFLRALAERYRDHPGLVGYDVWNECGYAQDTGYAPATIALFRTWLERRYGSLDAVRKRWRRHSIPSWDVVEPPRLRGPHPDSTDWLSFLQDVAHEDLRWRVETIRDVHPDALVTAHGVAGTFSGAVLKGTDDWRAAAEVDAYGYTWVAARQGDAPHQQIHAVDLVRAASRGRPFWHAEAQGGPLWMQPQVTGRPLDDGRVATAEDIRLWNLTSFAGGARGLLYPRWRPLLDGPLFDAFGPYGADGERTGRSAMASLLARWTQSESARDLWQAAPVRGEVGLVYVPEAQMHQTLLRGDECGDYADAMRGAARAFLEAGVQADPVHVDDIDDYALLYLPLPIRLDSETVSRLAGWVAAGGRLVSEGLPGHFGDDGRMRAGAARAMLGELFGAVPEEVLLVPDLLEDTTLEVWGETIGAAGFRETYRPSGADAAGRFPDGGLGAVEHVHGDGRTLLIGTYPGMAHQRRPRPGTPALFRRLLGWSAITPAASARDARVIARLHDGESGRRLWLLNPQRQAISTTVAVREGVRGTDVAWGAADAASLRDGELRVRVPARDGLVLRLS